MRTEFNNIVLLFIRFYIDLGPWVNAYIILNKNLDFS
jgi:hypothetical protein